MGTRDFFIVNKNFRDLSARLSFHTHVQSPLIHGILIITRVTFVLLFRAVLGPF